MVIKSILIKEKSKSHPSHYLIHKYWSRKPHNIVSNYIKYYTKEGDSVLDPFMGSGVTILESLKLNRNPIGIDLNPISVFLVDTMTSKINMKELEKSFGKIVNKSKKFQEKYFITQCSKCKSKAKLISSLFYENVKCDFCGKLNTLKNCKRNGSKYSCVHCNHNLKRINGNINYQLNKMKVDCPLCGKENKSPNLKDKSLMNKIHIEFKSNFNKHSFWAPNSPIPKIVRRSGKTKLYELFSERNILGINFLLNQIKYLSCPKKIKDALLLTLTSSISSASRMIPANEKTITGKSGWQIPKYYIFPTHIEKNIIEVFQERFRRNLKGLNELQEINSKFKPTLSNSSSKKINFIKSNSIDFIFTDPPYGGTIQYLSLSEIWNSLINKKSDINEEIIIDNHRKKYLDDYKNDLYNVFSECSRVLKKNKQMVLTFNARDSRIFQALINSCLKAGFLLEKINYQESAVTSATQGLNWKITLKGDFILLFKNKKKSQTNNNSLNINSNKIILEVIKDILSKNNLEFSDIFALLIPRIIDKGYFNLDSLELSDIYKTLSQNFNKEIKQNKVYWKIKN